VEVWRPLPNLAGLNRQPCEAAVASAAGTAEEAEAAVPPAAGTTVVGMAAAVRAAASAERVEAETTAAGAVMTAAAMTAARAEAGEQLLLIGTVTVIATDGDAVAAVWLVAAASGIAAAKVGAGGTAGAADPRREGPGGEMIRTWSMGAT